MTEVDVAVIGGGVTGLASALALARRGAAVCVLEREGKSGRATSTHNSGVIHAGIYYPQGSLKARLCVEGRDRLYRFCEEHHVPHARCGKLIIAADEHELEELDRLLVIGHANGVSTLIRVDSDFIRAKEPNVRAIGALWSLLAVAAFTRIALVIGQVPQSADWKPVLEWVPGVMWLTAGLLLVAAAGSSRRAGGRQPG